MQTKPLAAIGYVAAVTVFLAAAWETPVRTGKTDRVKEIRTSFAMDRFAGPATGDLTTE
ncbi:MAG: hypothetical protein QHC90_04195 [Shinella sp.]|jgi:hypothetical protein|nr:hypothetical protein [Shinella sp.]